MRLLLVLALLVQRQNQGPTRLQVGAPVSRTVTRSEAQHRFTVPMIEGQFARLVVDQHGVDLIVRVTALSATPPAGIRNVGEFDSPNGAEGPENIHFVSSVAGDYVVEVLPLNQNEEVNGRFEIRLVELRGATDPEIRAARDNSKERAVALLAAVRPVIAEMKSVQGKVRSQTQSARLLWPIDEKLARGFINEAIAAIRDYAEKGPVQEAYNSYSWFNTGMQMRQDVLNVLSANDPELALSFLQSTRTLANPDSGQNGQPDQELNLELQIANQTAVKDPKKAYQIAQDTLNRGYSANMANTVTSIRSADPAIAGKLMVDAAAKLMNDKLVSSPDAGALAVNLLRIASTPAPRNQNPNGLGPNAPLVDVPLLPLADYRNLLTKVLEEALAYPPDPSNMYSPEMNSARNMLNSLKNMPDEIRKISPASIKAIDDKLSQLNTQSNTQERYYSQVQDQNLPIEAALASIALAPKQMRDSLYQQLAQRLAGNGDLSRARQIVTDNIANARMRTDALADVERQAIQGLINKNRLEEAIAKVVTLKTPADRANIINQIVNRIANTPTKKDVALSILAQARQLIGVSPRAEEQNQWSALLQIAGSYGKYEPNRGFEIVEPLIDQLNEIFTAAQVLNGFGQIYFQEGELTNSNNLFNMTTQFGQTFGRLATADFDRAKNDAERIRRPEVRVSVFLAMAQQLLQPNGRNGPINFY